MSRFTQNAALTLARRLSRFTDSSARSFQTPQTCSTLEQPPAEPGNPSPQSQPRILGRHHLTIHACSEFNFHDTNDSSAWSVRVHVCAPRWRLLRPLAPPKSPTSLNIDVSQLQKNHTQRSDITQNGNSRKTTACDTHFEGMEQRL